MFLIPFFAILTLGKKTTLLFLIYKHVQTLTRARPFFFLFCFLRLTKYTISRSFFGAQKSITYQIFIFFSEHYHYVCQILFLFTFLGWIWHRNKGIVSLLIFQLHRMFCIHFKALSVLYSAMTFPRQLFFSGSENWRARVMRNNRVFFLA